jgi:hypothetical protein
MRYRSSMASLALALCMTTASAYAFDESKYQDWTGQWKLGHPAQMGSDQISWSGTASTPDSRVSGDFRGQPSGSSRGRTGNRPDLHLHPRRHAAGNERHLSDGNRDFA